MPGLQVTLEAYATEHLSDRRGCEEIVRLLAERTGMTILSMTGYDLKNSHGQEPGVSVNALIAESHIAIHTWPQEGVVTVDMYSCLRFHAEHVLNILQHFFNITKVIHSEIAPRWGPAKALQ